MKPTRTKAIILRRTNYGEADRIVQCITPDYGKVSMIAKGVRREKSKLAGGIELFALIDVTYIKGKSDLMMLTAARTDVFYRSIITDYDRLEFGYEAIKQINKAADALDVPAFFELLDQCYVALDTLTISLDVIKTWFWLQLGILLGLGLNLSADGNGEKLKEDARYNFDEFQNVFVIHESGTYTASHIKLLRVASARPPQIINQVGGIETLIDDCRWVAERSFSH